MTLAFLCNGYLVKYVPTIYKKRIGTSKFHPIRDTANYLGVVFRMVMYFQPLRFLSPLAGLLLLGGVGLGIYDFFFSELHTLQEIDVILFVGGLIVLSMGLVTELVVRQRATNDRELDYWRQINREVEAPSEHRS